MDFHFLEGQIYQQLVDCVVQSSEKISVSLKLCVILVKPMLLFPAYNSF